MASDNGGEYLRTTRHTSPGSMQLLVQQILPQKVQTFWLILHAESFIKVPVTKQITV